MKTLTTSKGLLGTLIANEDITKSQANRQASPWTGKLALWAALALFISMLATTAHAQMTSIAEGQPSQDLLSVIAMDQTGNLKDMFCLDNRTEIINGVTVTFSCNDNPGFNWIVSDAGAPGILPFSQVTGFLDPPPPPPIGPFGHFFYVDTAHHLHHLLTPNIPTSVFNEANNDLGVQSWGGISGYSSNGVGASASTVLDRVFYETSDQHIQMLVSANASTGGTSWNSDFRFGGPLARYGSDMTSFHDGSGEHVFYYGADQHLWEIYGSWISYYICSPFTHTCGPVSYVTWTSQDLTKQANGPLVYSGGNGSLTSFSDSTGEYVFYVGADAEIHEMSNAGSGWVPDENLTIKASAILPFTAGPTTSLTSLSNALGRQVFYIGTDLNVHQIVLTSNGGVDNNMTLNAQGPMAASSCFGLQLTSFPRILDNPNQRESDVFYTAADGSIHRLAQVGAEFTLQRIGFGPPVTLWEIFNWTDEGLPLNVINRCIQ